MLPDTELRLRRNARVVYRSAAAGLRPDPRMKISDWAAKHRIVPEMNSIPGPWRNEVTPELIEIMDAMSPEDPCEEGIVCKPSQSGGSAIAENMLGFIMHMAPGPAMYIAPTIAAAKDWKTEKLDPTITATPALNPDKGGVVYPNKSRSGGGSTSLRIRFKGGFLLFGGANSAASLRQHSIRYMVRDDLAGWTDNADGEGDPRPLSDQRLKTYRVLGLAKKLDVSTPLEKGDAFSQLMESSDKRRYYMACLGCGSVTDFTWADVQKNPQPPYHCRLVCPSCGRSHSEADKPGMKAPANGACWVPTAPDADGEVPPKTIALSAIPHWRFRETGRSRKGWYMTGVMNSFDRWDFIAAAEAAAGDDPDKVKPFRNTVLGEDYESKGEGPGWEALSARRSSDLERGILPAGALYVTLGVDVQGDGLYWERVGWGPNKESWLIDYGYLAGATDAPLEGAWPKLDMVVERGARFGSIRLEDDLIGVDSGYNAEAAYAWVRRRHNALALKGIDGWSKPAIFRAESTEVKKYGLSAGKARKWGLKVWLVGTYGLKGALMIYLSRTPKEGAAAPIGLSHFPAETEEEYFRHLVAEHVATEERAGENVRVWVRRGPNHWLDCRVYNWALTHYAGLWHWTEARWEERAKALAELTRSGQPTLFGDAAATIVAPRPLVDEAEETAEVPAATALAASQPRMDDALARLAQLNA